jgi:hypothetical protein
MANKKKYYIKNEIDLLRAMRSTGFCFPANTVEQKMSLKISSIADSTIQEKALEIDPNEIWGAENPIEYDKVKEIKPEIDYSEEWGIAARGNAKISKSALDKIKKNQKNEND